MKEKETKTQAPDSKAAPPETGAGGEGVLSAASSIFLISGVAFLISGLLNLAALVAGQFMNVKGDVVPGAIYQVLRIDGWLFSLLCVLSFTLMGVIGIAAGQGFRKRKYWSRSLAVSFSLMAGSSGILLAIYVALVPGLLMTVLYYLLLVYLFVSKPMERAFPVWVSRYGRSSSQFSLLFLINATALGSLVIGPMLPLLRFRHMAGGYVGVPLCSIGSISRSLSGNWADLLLAPIALIAVLMLVGVLVGRALCGWACPIGFLQDLGARAKASLGLGDIELSRKGHERLKLFKYAILLFVLILAVDIGVSTLLSPDAHQDFISGMTGFPLFQSGATPCEACPAPITGYFFPDDLLRNGLKGTFVMTPEGALRIFVLLGFVIGAFLMPRFFCRYFCPAGAMASLFNRASALSIEKDQEKCTECNYCVTACPMRVHKLKDEHVDSRVHDMECTFCLECIDSCPERALSLSFQGKTVYKGGKEWWLRTLKETEAAGSRQQTTGSRQQAEGRRATIVTDGQQAAEDRFGLSKSSAPETTAPAVVHGAGSRQETGGTEGDGKGAVIVVLMIVAMAFVPLLAMPVASAGQYDAVNLPPKDAGGNFSLGSRDSWTIRGAQLTINGSVVLNEEASITIDGGSKVTIIGDLWLAGRSTLNLIISQLTVFIPEPPPMRIEQLYTAPHGFAYVDESASMNLEGSKLTLARQQRTLMHGIVQPPSASSRGESFTYEIFYTDPADRPLSFLNVVIDGETHNLSQVDQNDTTYRDGIDLFYSSTLPPGNHTYHFEGIGPDGPLRYPLQGEIPGPHVETDSPIILFGSEMIVNFGSVIATNSTMEMSGSFYTHMSSRLEFTGSSLNAGLTIEINPTCIFRSSNIPSVVAKERTGRLNVFFYDCTVNTALMESFSNVLFERCTVAFLDLQSDSVTTVIQSTVNSFNCGGNASAYLDRATIRGGSFPARIAGNSQATAYNETTMTSVHMDNNARLYLTNAAVDTLSACNDVKVWSEHASIKNHTLLDNATILNTLKVRATLNGAPASVRIDVYSPGGDLLISTNTREDGFRSFAVPIRIITGTGSQLIESCTINISYRSLERLAEFSLKNGTSELNVSLDDRDPPRIFGVTFDYYYRSLGEALVTADIQDGQGSGIDTVMVRYSIDGKKWEERPLRQVGPSRYQGSIPGLGSGSEVRYHVTATDWMNNSGSSPRATETLGVPAATLAAVAVASLTILIVVGSVVQLIRYRKTRRYLEGRRPGGKEM